MNHVTFFTTPAPEGWNVYRVGGSGIVATFATLAGAKKAAQNYKVKLTVLFGGYEN